MPASLPQQVCLWGMACHLSGIVGLGLGILVPVPLIGLVVPGLVWRLGRERHPFIDAQGKEVLNFQISIALYSTLIIILGFFLAFAICGVSVKLPERVASAAVLIVGLTVGLPLVGLAIFQLGAVTFAAAKACNGESYHYPFTLRFIQ